MGLIQQKRLLFTKFKISYLYFEADCVANFQDVLLRIITN
jgi:hypothetical protein